MCRTPGVAVVDMSSSVTGETTTRGGSGFSVARAFSNVLSRYFDKSVPALVTSETRCDNPDGSRGPSRRTLIAGFIGQQGCRALWAVMRASDLRWPAMAFPGKC